MLGSSPSTILTDSLDITRFLGERYPRLIPSAYRDTIMSLLLELHKVWFVSLSFRREERRGEGIVNMIQELISRPSSSEEYQAALGKKFEL